MSAKEQIPPNWRDDQELVMTLTMLGLLPEYEYAAKQQETQRLLAERWQKWPDAERPMQMEREQ